MAMLARMHTTLAMAVFASLTAWGCQMTHQAPPPAPPPGPIAGPPGDVSGPPAASGALAAALKAAHDGDTIALPARTYAGNTLSGFAFARGVTVESADPAHPATLTDLSLTKSAGITFQGVVFKALVGGPEFPFQVGAAQRIAFAHDTWIGDPSFEHDGKAPNGLIVRNSAGVSVTASDFSELSTAINYDNGGPYAFSGNAFHDLHLRGIAGGGANGVTIADNRFWNFTPQNAQGVFDEKTMLHPDLIFNWSTPSELHGADVTITGNTFWRGTGMPIQGIMVSGTLAKRHGGSVSGVTISGNALFGEAWNGIAVSDADTVTISGNTVTGFCDQHPSRIIAGRKATITGNTAERFAIGGQFQASPPAGNSANRCVAPTAAKPG